MRKMTICLVALIACAACFGSPLEAAAQTGDWGGAPEGVIAYPHLGILGQFPTCFSAPLRSYIYHDPLW